MIETLQTGQGVDSGVLARLVSETLPVRWKRRDLALFLQLKYSETDKLLRLWKREGLIRRSTIYPSFWMFANTQGQESPTTTD